MLGLEYFEASGMSLVMSADLQGRVQSVCGCSFLASAQWLRLCAHLVPEHVGRSPNKQFLSDLLSLDSLSFDFSWSVWQAALGIYQFMWGFDTSNEHIFTSTAPKTAHLQPVFPAAHGPPAGPAEPAGRQAIRRSQMKVPTKEASKVQITCTERFAWTGHCLVPSNPGRMKKASGGWVVWTCY